MRSLLGAAIEDEVDVTIVDMEAGLEHLSRSGGTLAYSDVLLVVMEPTRKSVLTAARTRELAEELGIPRVYGVGNKARLPQDAEFYRTIAAEHGVELAGIVPHDPEVVAADRRGGALGPGEGAAARAAIEDVVAFVADREPQRQALLRERRRIQRRLAELGAE